MIVWHPSVKTRNSSVPFCEFIPQNFSQRHINAEIKSGGNGLVWKLTGFYGHPDLAKRSEA
jgi:hypothetical protein